MTKKIFATQFNFILERNNDLNTNGFVIVTFLQIQDVLYFKQNWECFRRVFEID